MKNDYIIHEGENILVTGAAGFIGSNVIQFLMRNGYKNPTCFVRPSSKLNSLKNYSDLSACP